MNDQPIRVLIADDHDLVREGLRGVLEADPAFAVVAEAADGTAAIEAARRHRPHVIVMDLQMPGTGGVAATRTISELLPESAVLVLTMYDDDDSVFAAIQAGARGYILKGAGRDELRAAVASAARGHTVFGETVARRVLGRLSDPISSRTADAFPTLTARQRDVLECLVDGLRPLAIAHRLAVSEKTVRNNISGVLTKLQAVDRAEAVQIARDSGIGRPRGPAAGETSEGRPPPS